jgi:DNA polymerase-3 subunit delta'
MLPWLEPIAETLSQRLEQERLGHAPLIHGPSGVGKRALGEWLMRRVLCARPREGQPCGECQSCRLIDGGTHPDCSMLSVPEDKRVIGVDAVRELIERLQLTASMGPHRVGLVTEADAMNRNAANAFLKTLEEPPSGAWLILLSEQPSRLPATIRSRCQMFALHPPSQEVGAAWLAETCPDASAEARTGALALCAGAPLAARDMLEQGELDAGLAILDDLREPGPQGEILERWQVDPAATWQWLARWLNIVMARHSGAPAWQPQDRPLPALSDTRALSRLWQLAIDGRREAARGVVRQDLLLGRWLLEWESAQAVRK